MVKSSETTTKIKMSDTVPQGSLPPLGADAGGTAPAKPRRRRQQRPQAEETVDGAQDTPNETVVDETIPPPKPRRRKPKPVQDGAGDATNENPDEAVAETTMNGATDGATAQRKRRRKRPQGDTSATGAPDSQRGQTNYALDLNLDDLKDDIVVLSPTTINVAGTVNASMAKPTDASVRGTVTAPNAEISQPTTTAQPGAGVKLAPLTTQQPTSQQDAALYVEERKRFRKTDKDQLQKEAEARLHMRAVEHRKSLIDASIMAHTVATKFAIFCEGLLAGFALWHIVVVAVMMNVLNYTSLVAFVFQFYGPFSNGASAMYLFLLYFAMLNTLDRIDIASITKRCGIKCATFQIPGICIVLYLVATILHMVCVPIEDQMYILYTNVTYVNLSSATAVALSSSITQTWYPVSLGRAILVIIAWFLLAVYPYKDRLKENLRKQRSGQEEFESENMQPLSDRRNEV